MKLKSILGSILLTVGALTFVSAPAYAGECSAEDPCQTYAMVDGSGTVTNIIVCQPSVCGSGMFAGSRVVPQVAANPITHQNQGGYLNVSGSPVTESNGVFTITNAGPTTEFVTIAEETKTTIISTTFEPGIQKSFTFEDTFESATGIPTFTNKPIDNSIGATLSVKELSNVETATVVSMETATVMAMETVIFEKRETEKFVELTLQINNLQRILRNWTYFKTSLANWFI